MVMDSRSASLIVTVVLAVSAWAGCGSADSAAKTTTTASSSVSRDGGDIQIVSREATTPVAVTGGTPTMRARARGILGGMGEVAITSVRFGRAPATYHQFRNVRGPDWVFVTVHARPLTRSSTPTQQDQRDWRLTQALVFERAYMADPTLGGYRIRGTSNNTIWLGAMQVGDSGTGGRSVFAAPSPAARTLIYRIKNAAAHAHFGVDSITVTHPDRLAVTARLKVSGHAGFKKHLNTFYLSLSQLAPTLDGLSWQLHTRCGTLVAQSAYGWFVNPRSECPEPFTLGFLPTRNGCRKLAAHFPATC